MYKTIPLKILTTAKNTKSKKIRKKLKKVLDKGKRL